LETLHEAKVYYAAEALMKLLAQLEADRPRVFGMLEQKVKGDGTKYNKLTKIVSVVPEDEVEDYADYHPYARPVDPRTANDDESIVCEECGEQTHGYERRSDGAWVSNVEAAKQSEAKHGKVLCGRCIWKSNQAPF